MCSGVGGTTRPHSYRKRYARRPSEPLGSWPRKRAFSAPSFNWQTPWRRRCQRWMVAPLPRENDPEAGAHRRVDSYRHRHPKATVPVFRLARRCIPPRGGRHPVRYRLAKPNPRLPPGTGRQPTGVGATARQNHATRYPKVSCRTGSDSAPQWRRDIPAGPLSSQPMR